VAFGKWLQGVRQKQGHSSQKEFAKLLDITDVQLSRIETGASGISAGTLNAIIDLLKLEPMEAYNKAGLLPEHIQQQETNEARQAEATRAAELIKDFLSLTPAQQAQAMAVIKILRSDHPELLQAPISIINADDIESSDAEESPP